MSTTNEYANRESRDDSRGSDKSTQRNEEDTSEDRLETKKCQICDEVLIHACRIGCGHIFCRYCINTKLQAGPGEEKPPLYCPLCSERVSSMEIENCPEIDAEIDQIFSSFLEEDQLSREAKKCRRTRLEKEMMGVAVGVGSSKSKENVRRTPSKTDNIPVLEASRVEYRNEDEDENSISTPLILHETITIHRTRVIDAGVGGRVTQENACIIGSTSQTSFHGEQDDEDQHRSNFYYPREQQPVSNHGTYAYSYHPYNNGYNNHYDYSTAHPYQYPSSCYGHSSCGGGTGWGYPNNFHSCNAESNHGGPSEEQGASSSYCTGPHTSTSSNGDLYGYYCMPSSSSTHQEEEQETHQHSHHNWLSEHQQPNHEDEDDYFEDDVGYGGQAYQGHHYTASQSTNIEELGAGGGCECGQCNNQEEDASESSEFESPRSHLCSECGGGPNNIGTVYHVAVSYQQNLNQDEENAIESDSGIGLTTGIFNNYFNTNNATGGNQDLDPEFEEFLATFESMGLSSPLENEGASGSGGGNNVTTGFMVN